MARVRGFCYTINNWTDLDVACIIVMCYETEKVTYNVTGYEIGDDGTPHIQGYVHFKDARTLKAVSKDLPRAHLEHAKAKGAKQERRWEYCKKDGDYWEYGSVPSNGKNTTFDKVILSINEGKTYKELCLAYPSYMLHHGNKVRRYMDDIKDDLQTEFYVCNPEDDAITEIYDYFQIPYQDIKIKVVIVTELKQLLAYDAFDIVVWYYPEWDNLQTLWPRGVPITYNYGYEVKQVRCLKFVIVTRTPNLYPFYKKI